MKTLVLAAFTALTLTDGLVYDRQDMFYVPFAGLRHVTRPGPNFALYARRDAAFNADLSTVAH